MTSTQDVAEYHLLYLVVRGMNDRIYWNLWDGSWLPEWQRLPGATSASPGAAVQGDHDFIAIKGNLHLVVKGMTGGLYHGYVDCMGYEFTGWTRISGETPSAPTLTPER